MSYITLSDLGDLLMKQAVTDSLDSFNPLEQNVSANTNANDLITKDTIMILSGPPLFEMALKNPSLLKPMGFTSDLGIQSNKSYVPIPEMGVDITIKAPMRVNNSINMSSILVNKTSVLYDLYRWYCESHSKDPKTSVGIVLDQLSESIRGRANLPGSNLIFNADKNKQIVHHFDNLYSSLFLIPTGILAIYLDGYYNYQKAIYLENLKIENKVTMISLNPVITTGLQGSFSFEIPAGEILSSKSSNSLKLIDYLMPDADQIFLKDLSSVSHGFYQNDLDRNTGTAGVDF